MQQIDHIAEADSSVYMIIEESKDILAWTGTFANEI